MAERAEPDRARYRDRSRRAKRAAMGAFRPDSCQQGQEERRHEDDPRDQRDEPGYQPDHAAASRPRPRAENMKNPRTSAITPGTNERWICRGGAGPAGQGADHRDPGDGAGGMAGGEEGGDDGEHHRHHDHRPRQGEHRDEVVRALLVVRAVGQPRHQAQRESHQGTHHPDDHAVRPQHETDVAVGRPHRLEHPERSQSALRQHGEAADRHQRDQQHADGRQRQHDGLRD